MQPVIIIPARDEAATIRGVVGSARAAMPDAGIIVVDDASGDATAALARDAGAEVLSLARQAGYAGALHAGYRRAAALSPCAVLQMDADGQHRAEDLPRLLAALSHADIVLGSRFLGPTPGYRIPPIRRVGMAACRWMAWWVGGLGLSDPTSGLRALSADAAAHIAVQGFPAGLTETSMLIHMHRVGFTIREVPVRMRASRGSSMHAGLAGGAHFLRISRAVMALAGEGGSAAHGPGEPRADHPSPEPVVPRGAM